MELSWKRGGILKRCFARQSMNGSRFWLLGGNNGGGAANHVNWEEFLPEKILNEISN
jgi:hypothetical protein